jgi:dTDP-4-amino-4,6-dideoxygalactose transaminase
MNPDRSSLVSIPAEDLTRQYAQIADEIHHALDAVLPRGKYTLGPDLAAFEQEFAAYCDCRFALGIANGTEALHLALAALSIGPGDEVITACNTYAATAFAISYVGARPVFADVEPDTFNLDAACVAEKISPRTRAIVPVHMYGQPVVMEPLLDLARQHHLHVIEDASHAHGATHHGHKTGSFGDAGCFSFYPSKVLGAYGDAGAITTNDPQICERIKVLRYMGQRVKHAHEEIGFQQRLDEMQAAILRVKLRHLDEWIAQRRRWANVYDELLSDVPVITPRVAPDCTHVYYLYTIRVPAREALREFLTARGIGTQIIYPTLVPFQKAYANLGYQPGDFPVGESLTREILCLPMFPELREQEVRIVADAIASFFGHSTPQPPSANRTESAAG